MCPAITCAQQPEPRDYELPLYMPGQLMMFNAYLRQYSASSVSADYSLASLAMRATYVFKRTTKVGNFSWAPIELVLPILEQDVHTPLSSLNPAFSQLPTDVKLTTHATGVGDFSFLQTLEYSLVEDEKEHTHSWLAFSLVVTTPTGSYDKERLVNLGGHRWIINPIVAIGQRFLRAITLEAMGTAAFYTHNAEYRAPTQELAGRDLTLKQRPTWTGSVHLAVDLHPALFGTLSYLATAKGREIRTRL